MFRVRGLFFIGFVFGGCCEIVDEIVDGEVGGGLLRFGIFKFGGGVDVFG